ncbi:Dienelactone hydrolase family protein [Oceanibacterium hippocampi]|uniref:Dienelactone hydrolase family protein n=2 Tax=Oceanibacterium hippocampi TaxID=745714 RepID=A0A1Y5S136_9PROT|nr:Dienelactone hydrolase family protein [Oceanibacterium hippocampi]
MIHPPVTAITARRPDGDLSRAPFSRRWRCAVLLLLGFVLIAPAAPAGATDNGPSTAWTAALIAVPPVGGRRLPIFGRWRDSFVQRAVQEMPETVRLPAVLFMHGCDGIGGEEEAARILFMEWGYATFIPDSFARAGRRSNCATADFATSRAPESHDYRLQELAYGIQALHSLSWIDHDRIFAYGFSEGGMAVARYEGNGLSGRVITGWHCRGIGPYDGIGAPRDTPLLAILGDRDPWYAAKPGEHCGQVFDGRADAESIILPGNGHAILNSPDLANAERARKAIRTFLDGH